MNKIVMLGLLLMSTMLHANCGDLEIEIINNSPHNCTFKNKLMYYGVLFDCSVPSVIPAHVASASFVASQDNIGVGAVLAYTCGDELVKFYSYQDFCSIFGGAGQVRGEPFGSSTLSLSYETKLGSYFWGRPGRIIWRIS